MCTQSSVTLEVLCHWNLPGNGFTEYLIWSACSWKVYWLLILMYHQLAQACSLDICEIGHCISLAVFTPSTKTFTIESWMPLARCETEHSEGMDKPVTCSRTCVHTGASVLACSYRKATRSWFSVWIGVPMGVLFAPFSLSLSLSLVQSERSLPIQTELIVTRSGCLCIIF